MSLKILTAKYDLLNHLNIKKDTSIFANVNIWQHIWLTGIHIFSRQLICINHLSAFSIFPCTPSVTETLTLMKNCFSWAQFWRISRARTDPVFSWNSLSRFWIKSESSSSSRLSRSTDALLHIESNRRSLSTKSSMVIQRIVAIHLRLTV